MDKLSDAARNRNKYQTDPEYRARKLAKVKERYERLAAEGLNRRNLAASRATKNKALPLRQCEGCGRMFSPPTDGNYYCAKCKY